MPLDRTKAGIARYGPRSMMTPRCPRERSLTGAPALDKSSAYLEVEPLFAQGAIDVLDHLVASPIRRPITAALAFLQVAPQTSALRALHVWLDSWRGVGLAIENVRLTPELTTIGRGVSCTVVNGGATDAAVLVELISNDGTVKLSGTSTIPPSQSAGQRPVQRRIELSISPLQGHGHARHYEQATRGSVRP